MGKKYLRKIIVDNVEYIWMCGRYNCDGDGGVLLTIYQNKKEIFSKLFHGETITPKIVEEEIKKVNGLMLELVDRAV